MHQPEAVVDMHNTSGSGPSFGVCTFVDRQHDALVSLFTQRLIVSNLRLGALMDISEHSYPTVTVEVGGRLDEAAHELAFDGLCRYFTAKDVLSPEQTDWGLELLRDPIRLELRDNVTLTYAETPCADHALRQPCGAGSTPTGTAAVATSSTAFRYAPWSSADSWAWPDLSHWRCSAPCGGTSGLVLMVVVKLRLA